ncbi:MAG: response regulator [Cyclobacteriaceae bacterium]
MKEYISKEKGLNLVGSFATGLEVRNFLENNSVDLAFLDINMPEISGTSLVRVLKQKPLIIFTTAYSEHAVEGFELDIIDYLTKPISFERFLKSVDKAKHYHQLLTSKTPPSEYFFVKADYKIVKINFNEILFIEGLREYVRIHTPKKKIITLLAMAKT